jgi:hypothetical protein
VDSSYFPEVSQAPQKWWALPVPHPANLLWALTEMFKNDLGSLLLLRVGSI